VDGLPAILVERLEVLAQRGHTHVIGVRAAQGPPRRVKLASSLATAGHAATGRLRSFCGEVANVRRRLPVVEMRVSEQVLPGIGMRYEIDVAGGRRLFVIARRDGRREIGVMGEADEPETHVVLDQQGAVTIAALLLGARFTVDTREEAWVSSDEVVVDVIELREDSPAVGLYQAELELADPEAVVLAVMSDTTPDLVESETEHRCQVGDRIVVAARAARIAHVTAALQSPSHAS